MTGDDPAPPDPPRVRSGAWTLRRIALHTAVLGIVLAVYHFTTLDLRVQDRIFDFAAGRWPISQDARLPHFFFYAVPDIGLGLFGLTCIGLLVASSRKRSLRRHRRFAALVVVALIVVPVSVSQLKRNTRCLTPDRIFRYGGNRPYVRAFETYPLGVGPRGSPRGWPAGHASGGFALMMLAFACRRRRTRRLGLAIGLTLGWTTGVFQMLRGLHYFSDNVVTMELAWIEILGLQWVLSRLAWLDPPDEAGRLPAPGAAVPEHPRPRGRPRLPPRWVTNS